MTEEAGRSEDYVWVVVESLGQEEVFLGLNDADSGETFIPVTAEREHGLSLLARLPLGPQGSSRQVEAIHQSRLLNLASDQGFAVYLVDQEGRLVQRLDQATAH